MKPEFPVELLPNNLHIQELYNLNPSQVEDLLVEVFGDVLNIEYKGNTPEGDYKFEVVPLHRELKTDSETMKYLEIMEDDGIADINYHDGKFEILFKKKELEKSVAQTLNENVESNLKMTINNFLNKGINRANENDEKAREIINTHKDIIIKYPNTLRTIYYDNKEVFNNMSGALIDAFDILWRIINPQKLVTEEDLGNGKVKIHVIGPNGKLIPKIIDKSELDKAEKIPLSSIFGSAKDYEPYIGLVIKLNDGYFGVVIDYLKRNDDYLFDVEKENGEVEKNLSWNRDFKRRIGDLDNDFANLGPERHEKEVVEFIKRVLDKYGLTSEHTLQKVIKENITESVRFGVYPYFVIDRETLNVKKGEVENDLAQDAIQWDVYKHPDKLYGICISDWNKSMRDNAAETALELIKQGKTNKEIDEVFKEKGILYENKDYTSSYPNPDKNSQSYVMLALALGQTKFHEPGANTLAKLPEADEKAMIEAGVKVMEDKMTPDAYVTKLFSILKKVLKDKLVILGKEKEQEQFMRDQIELRVAGNKTSIVNVNLKENTRQVYFNRETVPNVTNRQKERFKEFYEDPNQQILLVKDPEEENMDNVYYKDNLGVWYTSALNTRAYVYIAPEKKLEFAKMKMIGLRNKKTRTFF